MSVEAQGELVPVGGGDPIPLLRSKVSIGRRESCDVCLRFPTVSGKHCELYFTDGHWYIRDLGSQNGTKVNGQRIYQKKMLRPGDQVAIAKHRFKIAYALPIGHEILVDVVEEDLNQPLLEKAGLERPRRNPKIVYRAQHTEPGPFLVPEVEDDVDDDDD
jgi:adenylate cyclase